MDWSQWSESMVRSAAHSRYKNIFWTQTDTDIKEKKRKKKGYRVTQSQEDERVYPPNQQKKSESEKWPIQTQCG